MLFPRPLRGLGALQLIELGGYYLGAEKVAAAAFFAPRGRRQPVLHTYILDVSVLGDTNVLRWCCLAWNPLI